MNLKRGLKRAEFCRSRALALGTLQRHLRARRLATEAATGRPRLVAVSVTPRGEAVLKPAETTNARLVKRNLPTHLNPSNNHKRVLNR
jgi:hypothetical protein